jgi:hypothetical protein
MSTRLADFVVDRRMLLIAASPLAANGPSSATPRPSCRHWTNEPSSGSNVSSSRQSRRCDGGSWRTGGARWRRQCGVAA